jgi:putative ABC transport system permease protein
MPLLRGAELRDLIARSMGDLHLAVRFVVVFGALALLLAAVGLYGLLSYSVVRRRREVGVRVALGATPRDIQQLVLTQSLRLALTGLAAGLVLALAMSRLIGRLLFGVAAVDPATMTATALLLLIVAGAAAALPTRAAVRARPADVLRE